MSGLRFESMADMPPRMREAYARQVLPEARAQQSAAKYHNPPLTLFQWRMGNGSKMNGSLLTFRRCTTAASVISQSSRSTLHFRNAVNTVGR